MPRAVVPIDANFLRAAADASDTEKEFAVRAVEMTRRKRELAELFSHRAFVQFAIVGRQRGAVTVQIFADRFRRQLAMLERARNPLAHQRIDAGRIAGENDASG